MLDINLIREETERVKEGVRRKQISPSVVDEVLSYDIKWRAIVRELDELRSRQKKGSSQTLSPESRGELKKLKEEIKRFEEEERTLRAKRDEALQNVPNIPFDDVPEGKDDTENIIEREVGKRPSFDFEPRDYLTIAENLGLIDVKHTAQVAGSRFGYLLRDAALLEFALVKLAFDLAVKEGFTPVVPPVMARPDVMRAMGKGKFLDEHDAFHIAEDDLYLVGSAEHTIGPLHMNEVLDASTLPRRYVGFSTAFRRESGSYGRDTRGILRVHQFDKVELFSFTHPKRSEEELLFLLSLEERLMQALKLPYRVVLKCTGDMTWGDARQYDIETWLPSEGRYRETHSASNLTDFQSRGIRAEFREGGERGFVHTLNATGLAIQRTLIMIIENYQTKEGNVKVPKVLQKYMGKKIIGDNKKR
ncbi:serine--tRNA ligase [Candidatus Jorgensenbacteria bacterium GWA1_54_12]|uniref:Serine--tRNA ligase n=1 Tax=Candidatus Jorgensenbacteria bacterium GWA1_54_12 TaxID=1798468 RepID=A0A1F6BIN4_9BACT|nr:MAG: serine--tRNA ligase [Candidatus Jorgensenbacteria bacterium GWA1_54_12]